MNRHKKYIKLGLCLLSIYLLIAFIIPFINGLKVFRPMQEVVREYDINCAAFFYTDDISDNEQIKKHTDL